MKYDCVVVGGGISGIVAATGLVVEGKKTLLVEKQNRPGGYFSGFVNDYGDKFDYAISYVLSCGEGDVFTEYLKKLGIEKEIRLFVDSCGSKPTNRWYLCGLSDVCFSIR